MTDTTPEAVERLDLAVAEALILLARRGIDADVQGLLVHGSPERGVPPGALAAVIGRLVAQPTSQFLATEDGEFNGNTFAAQPAPVEPVASIVPDGCAGATFVFELGHLHVTKDGWGYFCVPDADLVFEDDRTVGPDGQEGSVHWIARMDASEIMALRDFLNGAPAAQTAPEDVGALVADAMAEATKAMRKFPQPNYVISKVAEEAGEVVKAAIHCAEGRERPEAVRGEIVQCMAMLIRLYLEGDQVHGLAALAKQGGAE